MKHKYYVEWIVEQLAKKGMDCKADKVGPDIQIPSRNITINV